MGLDGVEGEPGIDQELAEDALSSTDIEDRRATQVSDEAGNLLMATPGIAMQPVVELVIVASAGGGRSRAFPGYSGRHRGSR